MNNNKKSTALAVMTIAAMLSMTIAVATGCGCNKDATEEDTATVKTEIATDANGTPSVVQGTAPNGTLIQNNTYPDGTEVEFATTAQGEYATEADGSYIINYTETTLVPDSSNSNSSSSVTQEESNKNTSDKNNNKNNQSISSSAADKGNTSSKPTTSTEKATKPNSSQGGSTQKPDNNSSSSTTQAPTNKPSDNTGNNNSSSTVTPPTDNGDANADINAGAYKVGDKIKVSYYLQSNIKFCGIQCDINYDSSALKIDTESIDMSKLSGPMCNPAPENQIRFLASAATAVNDFTKEKLLFSCEFEVLKTTDGDVTINVVDILDDNVLSIPSDQYKITAKVEKVK